MNIPGALKKRLKRFVVAATLVSTVFAQLTYAAELNKSLNVSDSAEHDYIVENHILGAANQKDDPNETDDTTNEDVNDILTHTIIGNGSGATSLSFNSAVSKSLYAEANTIYSVSTNLLPNSEYRYARFVMPVDGYLKFAMKGSEDAAASTKNYLYTTIRIKKPNNQFASMLYKHKMYERKSAYTSPEWGLKKGTVILLKLSNHNAVLPYTFSFAVTPSDVWEKEYNDEVKYANTVSENIAYSGNFSYADGYDWYTHIADESKRLCVNVNIDNNTEYASSKDHWYVKVYVNDKAVLSRRKVKLKSASKTFITPSFNVKKGDKIDFYISEGTAPIGANYKITLSSDVTQINVVKGQRVNLYNYAPNGLGFYVPDSYKKCISVNKKGIMKAKKVSESVVRYSENGVSRELVFNVEKPELDTTSLALLKENGSSINVSDLIYNVGAEPIDYRISKVKIATVDEYGTVTALSGGSVKLTVVYGTNALPKKYNFKLRIPCTTLKKEFVKVKEETTKKVNVKYIYGKDIQVSPLDATIADATLIKSGNGQNGKLCITGKKAGSTAIYVKSNGVDYICNVEVMLNPKLHKWF